MDGVHRGRREWVARLALDGRSAPRRPAKYPAILDGFGSRRRPYDVEYRVRRYDGVYGWFKTRGVPIRNSKGDIVKWFGTCTDITDRKRAEEALRQREQELRKARNELEKKVAERT